MIVKAQYELTLSELLILIREKWKTLLIMPAVIALIALAITFAITPQWEGGVIFQIGQNGPESSIETPSLIVARINNPSLKNSIAGAEETIITARSSKDEMNIIRVKVRSTDKATIKTIARKIFEEQLKIHNALLADSSRYINEEMATNDEDIKRINSEILSFSSGKKTPVNESVIKDLLSEKNKILDTKRTWRLRVSPQHFFSTKMIGETYLLDQIVYPERKLVFIAALVIGFLATFAFVVFSHVVNRK